MPKLLLQPKVLYADLRAVAHAAGSDVRGQFVSPLVRKAVQAQKPGEAGGADSPYSAKTLQLLAGTR